MAVKWRLLRNGLRVRKLRTNHAARRSASAQVTVAGKLMTWEWDERVTVELVAAERR